MSKEKFVRSKPHVNIGKIYLIIFGITSAISLGMTIYIDIIETRDSDGDSIPDLEEVNAAQPLFFEVSEETVFFRTYETDISSHEVGHNLGLSHDGLSSHVNVELGLYDDVSTAIPILNFKIKYDSLIEFIDDNGNGFFEPTETIVGKTSLNNMLRLGFGFGVDGEPVYYSNYSTTDEVFKVNFYTTREHVLLGRQVGSLSPFELKSSIRFTDYLAITGGTQLALNLSLSASQDISFSDSTAMTSIGDYKVVYQLADSALINGAQTPVNTTLPGSPANSGQIYLNFGSVINGSYDPKLSWEVPSTPRIFSITDVPWSYIAIGSVSIIAITTAAKIPRGKKKKQPEPKPKPFPGKFDPIASTVEPAPPGYPGSQKSPEEESTDHVPRKKPGRVKYADMPKSQQESSNKTTEAEKRIPSTIRHRDR